MENFIVTVSFGYDMKYILFITFQFNIYVYIYIWLKKIVDICMN